MFNCHEAVKHTPLYFLFFTLLRKTVMTCFCQTHGDDLLRFIPQRRWKGDSLEWDFCVDSESVSGSEFCVCSGSDAAVYTGTAGRENRGEASEGAKPDFSSHAFRPLKWITKLLVCCSKDVKSSWISENCQQIKRC